MRVIRDPKTEWKATCTCSQCKAVLEIEAADVSYVELGSGLDNLSDWYYVVRCPICQKVIELDRATLPEWVLRERKKVRAPEAAKVPLSKEAKTYLDHFEHWDPEGRTMRELWEKISHEEREQIQADLREHMHARNAEHAETILRRLPKEQRDAVIARIRGLP